LITASVPRDSLVFGMPRVWSGYHGSTSFQSETRLTTTSSIFASAAVG
jgi:hypothetical protein